MEKVRARELLNDPEVYGKLTVVSIRNLMVAADYSAEQIQRTINKRGNERLDAGLEM